MRRVVIRTTPRPDELDAEPNYFAAVEFDQADFPWRYTPARADARGRLRPWLVLAVRDRERDQPTRRRRATGRLPSRDRRQRRGPAAPLPVLGLGAHTDRRLRPIQRIARGDRARATQRACARVCSRRGACCRNTAYRALLVPAFERGRRAGLRRDPRRHGRRARAGLGRRTPSISGCRSITSGRSRPARRATSSFWPAGSTARRRRSTHSASRDMDVRTPDPALPAASADAARPSKARSSRPRAPARHGRPPSAGAVRRPRSPSMLNQPAENLASTGGEATVAPPLWGDGTRRPTGCDDGSDGAAAVVPRAQRRSALARGGRIGRRGRAPQRPAADGCGLGPGRGRTGGERRAAPRPARAGSVRPSCTRSISPASTSETFLDGDGAAACALHGEPGHGARSAATHARSRPARSTARCGARCARAAPSAKRVGGAAAATRALLDRAQSRRGARRPATPTRRQASSRPDSLAACRP